MSQGFAEFRRMQRTTPARQEGHHDAGASAAVHLANQQLQVAEFRGKLPQLLRELV